MKTEEIIIGGLLLWLLLSSRRKSEPAPAPNKTTAPHTAVKQAATPQRLPEAPVLSGFCYHAAL